MHPQDNEFSVTLVSNASTDKYPNNHVFNFTNVLAKPLVLPRYEKWRVCLQSVSLPSINDEPEQLAAQRLIEEKSEEFKKSLQKVLSTLGHDVSALTAATNLLYKQTTKILEDKLDSFHTTNSLFIECDQIIPKYEPRRILSSFVIPPTHIRGEFFHYEPETEEYFDLATTDINFFNIKILNANAEKISRTASQPTIIVLKFKKMTNETSSYTVTIDNGTQNPEQFYAKFPLLSALQNVSTKWEMAVSRVSFVPLFRKFPSGGFDITLVTDVDDFLSKLTTHTWDSYLSEKPKQTANLKYAEHFTPQTLLAPISEAVQALAKKAGLTGKMVINDFDQISFKIAPSTMTEELKKKPYLLILPEELIYVLGFDNEGIIFNNGYGALPSNYGKKLTARRNLDINFLVPQNLLLYVDCVKPSLVGNAYGKYLTNIPIPIRDASQDALDLSYIVYEPKNLEFHPLKQNDIDHVLVQLLKVDGKPPEFVTNQVKIFISFLLRKRKGN